MIENPNRPDKRSDLTRWNRAGLSRFQYVDGDAAVWLEELRIALLGLTARGAPFEERLPETWRERFSQAEDQWPSVAERAAFDDALVWKALARAYPDRPETARRRNARLLAQYAAPPDEYGWEIARAAARAAHVLLGHQNAYANEGYLRTATQWDNIRKLAAMVNHQPAPPSSAIVTVGLIVERALLATEIPRGLAMKYTPPEGGAPVIFETLKPIKTHADLNDARAAGWNFDPEPLNFADDLWIADEEAALSPGSVGVLAAPSGDGPVSATTILDVGPGPIAGAVEISLDASGGWPRGAAVLHVDPKDTRRGSPRSTASILTLRLASAASHPVGSIVLVNTGGGGGPQPLKVLANADGHLKLDSGPMGGENVTVETLVPFSGSGASLIVSLGAASLGYFANASGGIETAAGVNEPAKDADDDVVPGKFIGIRFNTSAATGNLYVPASFAKRENAAVVGAPPVVVPGASKPERVVSFAGKPPKGLAVGDHMIMRAMSGGALTALRVAGVLVGADRYTLEFHADVTADIAGFEPDRFEFLGPMTRALRPFDFDRDPNAAFDGATVLLAGLDNAAQDLIRPGRACLIEDERAGGAPPALVMVLDAFEGDWGFEVVFASSEGLAGFQAGWTKLNFNAVLASHGETKSPKTLGSGDAERPRQAFPFSAKGVSFVPSSVAETGVAPDMDVAVDGVIWAYRDLIDPLADGTESYSVALTEDNAMTIQFRRRLPTGANNVIVRRHRVGVGPGGTVPARAFTKPMKKNRHVLAVTQPFAATGGAEREPVEDIRANAPARLAANGRAVSLRDFERLCARRSDIWQARARASADPKRSERVAVVIVPANGGEAGPTLAAEMKAYLQARTLPGLRVAIEDYRAVRLILQTTIFVKVEKFDKNDVRVAAHAALVTEFGLARRRLGQPVYIAEVAAALERVEGVETATVQAFGVSSDSPDIERVAVVGGAASALFPAGDQVIHVYPASAGADFTVAVEAL
ncbi:MAG: hypothetical protein WD969_01735 [Paracoccaceae bacterium]